MGRRADGGILWLACRGLLKLTHNVHWPMFAPSCTCTMYRWNVRSWYWCWCCSAGRLWQVWAATLGLRDVLQWLSVPQQIQFKIAFLAFICVRGAGPTCLPTRLHTDSSTNLSDRAGLRCAGCRDLAVLRTAMEVLRKRSFHVAAQVSSAVPCRLLYTGHRCCRQAASQVSHTATDGGATTSAYHCRTTSIRCARPHSLELSARRPPCTAGLWVP